MRYFKLLVLVLLVNTKAYSMPVKDLSQISFMRVMISAPEFSYDRVSNSEYKINGRYSLVPTFVKGTYKAIIEKLKNYTVKNSSDDPILLEYVTLGDGKKVVTSIAIP